MTGGVVTGGWNYVVAAYAVTGVMLGGYIASVLVRWRQELGRREGGGQ
jgi:hypothetical protein